MPLLFIFTLSMYTLWPSTVFARRTEFDGKRWTSFWHVLENLLLPSIVGELPELSQNGLRLWDHYYFEFGPSYALADDGTLGHYQVRGSRVRSWLRLSGRV